MENDKCRKIKNAGSQVVRLGVSVGFAKTKTVARRLATPHGNGSTSNHNLPHHTKKTNRKMNIIETSKIRFWEESEEKGKLLYVR